MHLTVGIRGEQNVTPRQTLFPDAVGRGQGSSWPQHGPGLGLRWRVRRGSWAGGGAATRERKQKPCFCGAQVSARHGRDVAPREGPWARGCAWGVQTCSSPCTRQTSAGDGKAQQSPFWRKARWRPRPGCGLRVRAAASMGRGPKGVKTPDARWDSIEEGGEQTWDGERTVWKGWADGPDTGKAQDGHRLLAESASKQ